MSAKDFLVAKTDQFSDSESVDSTPEAPEIRDDSTPHDVYEEDVLAGSVVSMASSIGKVVRSVSRTHSIQGSDDCEEGVDSDGNIILEGGDGQLAPVVGFKNEPAPEVFEQRRYGSDIHGEPGVPAAESGPKILEIKTTFDPEAHNEARAKATEAAKRVRLKKKRVIPENSPPQEELAVSLSESISTSDSSVIRRAASRAIRREKESRIKKMRPKERKVAMKIQALEDHRDAAILALHESCEKAIRTIKKTKEVGLFLKPMKIPKNVYNKKRGEGFVSLGEESVTAVLAADVPLVKPSVPQVLGANRDVLPVFELAGQVQEEETDAGQSSVGITSLVNQSSPCKESDFGVNEPTSESSVVCLTEPSGMYSDDGSGATSPPSQKGWFNQR